MEKGSASSTSQNPCPICALGRIRNGDLRFRKPLLYPLSYEGGDGAKCGAKFAATHHVIYIEVTRGSRRLEET